MPFLLSSGFESPPPSAIGTRSNGPMAPAGLHRMAPLLALCAVLSHLIGRMQRVALFFASWGYTGYAPVASGTFGTLAAIPFFWLFARIPSAPVAVAACIAAIALACWLAGMAEKALDEHDSGIIVIDEVVGYLAATLLLPPTWTVTIFAFFLFRLFDIIKPPPASYFDKQVKGGIGVVLDDVFAGIYANLATRAVLLITGHILG